MEFSSKPNRKCTENPQSSISTHPFSDAVSKISKPTVWNQQIGKQCFLPPLSFTITLRVTSFHISLKSSGFLFLQNACLIFSDLYIPTCMGKIFQFMVFTFL